MITDKKDFLFKFVDSSIRRNILLDDEALYSTTDQTTANKIAREIARFINVNGTITDATACIGGSAHAFAQIFNKVIAIENDKLRYEYLKNNMELLVNSNVKCIHGDAIDECKKQFQDAIFIDPPWGGPQYKSMPQVMLFLSGKTIADVVRELVEYTNYIVLKVPLNFDEDTFKQEVTDIVKIESKNTLRKMNLLVLKRVTK